MVQKYAIKNKLTKKLRDQVMAWHISKKNFNNKNQYTQKYSLIAITLLMGLVIVFAVNILQHKKIKYIKQNIELPSIDEENYSDIPNDYNDWITITTKEHDTLGKIISTLNINPGTLQNILKNNKFAKELINLRPNQQIRFLIKNNTLLKIIFPHNTTEMLIVELKDNTYTTKIEKRTIDMREEFLSVTIHGSLHASAKKQQLPFTIIQQMAKIFEWEINFAKDLREGDIFNIIYESFYVDDTKINSGKVIAIEYKSKNRTLQAIAHKNNNGDIDYYTPQGRSLKKAFSRYPIQFSHISSNFSLARKHPILNYVRPHKGVDLAARLGTPIYATGDGRIKSIGMNHGYGNMIKIVHNKTYSTIYAHLLKFQKGLYKGAYVKRGQLIGYVGQTGLATAPHCHYEFHINQKAQNPTTVQLPQAESVPNKDKSYFDGKAKQLIANLNLYTASNLADAKIKKDADTG